MFTVDEVSVLRLNMSVLYTKNKSYLNEIYFMTHSINSNEELTNFYG